MHDYIKSIRKRRLQMDRFFILKIVAAGATLWILYKLIRELGKSIKESNNGKISERCDLD